MCSRRSRVGARPPWKIEKNVVFFHVESFFPHGGPSCSPYEELFSTCRAFSQFGKPFSLYAEAYAEFLRWGAQL